MPTVSVGSKVNAAKTRVLADSESTEKGKKYIATSPISLKKYFKPDDVVPQPWTKPDWELVVRRWMEDYVNAAKEKIEQEQPSAKVLYSGCNYEITEWGYMQPDGNWELTIKGTSEIDFEDVSDPIPVVVIVAVVIAAALAFAIVAIAVSISLVISETGAAGGVLALLGLLGIAALGVFMLFKEGIPTRRRRK